MTASFGKLQNQSLEFKNGFNIIQAPNETGKSTWCAFLLSMLYGINSRERDKSGFIAEKNRYAPWTGAVMSGRLDCETDQGEITLTRTTRRQTAPMAEFKAVYTGTESTISTLTGQNCGEMLLGVNREVYERSAFIRQAGLSISQDAGLERRIAALITSGEEDVSYTEAYEILKKQLTHRRFNKHGQLPALETELAELEQQIRSTENIQRQLADTQLQVQALEISVAALSSELLHHDRWDALQKQRQLAELTAIAEASVQNAAALRRRADEEHLPENDTIGRLRGALVNLETTRKAVDKARAARDEAAKIALRAEAAVNESPFAGQTADDAWKTALTASDTKPWPLSELLPSIFLGLIALYLVVASLVSGAFDVHTVLEGIPCVIIALFLPFYKNHKWKKETSAFLKKYRVATAAELRELSSAYKELLNAKDTAQAELDKRSAAADTLYNTLSSNEQAILLEIRRFAPTAFDVSAADALLRECAQRRKALSDAELSAREACMRRDMLAQQLPLSADCDTTLSPPERTRDTVVSELEHAKVALATVRSTADRLTGQLHAAGDLIDLHASADRLKEDLARVESEYTAISLAMNTLEQSNTTLQNRFSPALGKRTAEIFSELTEGRYRSVVLDRKFHLSAEPKNDTIYRDAQLLSAGTGDQLYLATRLAICELVLPSQPTAPLVLDDALANFDDTRCAAALRWLKKTAQHRQILLFTCHSREADFFSNDQEVCIQRLTNDGQEV